MSNIAKEQERKSLQSRLEKIDGELKSKKEEQAAVSRQVNDLMLQKKDLTDRLKKLDKSVETIGITEHAVLRYLERVKGFNLKEIESEILSDRDIQNILALGTCEIKRANHKIIVKNRRVITVE